jgi:hypothetical protein
MALSGAFVDQCSLLAYRAILHVVALNGGHELDVAVAVLVVLAAYEHHHPAAGLVLAAKGALGLARRSRPEAIAAVRLPENPPARHAQERLQSHRAGSPRVLFMACHLLPCKIAM